MSPAQFLSRVRRGDIPSVCLFIGQESYNRQRCREALLAARSVNPETLDGSEVSLAAILDDARAMSLFPSERLILIANAEATLPRVARASTEDEEDGPTSMADAGVLERYVADPMPGVTLVFEATRWDLEGEDKQKSDRVRKFYGPIGDVIEFRRFTPDEARIELAGLAKALGVKLDPAAAEALVEALAADMGRIAVEMEKLALYGKPIAADEISILVPDARQSTIFALVNALGRRDRTRALSALDALIREGEYLPLALTFLATQFRTALAVKEANLRGPQQVQSHFQRVGLPVWSSRAEQVWSTASKFTMPQLERGLKLIFEADRDLRSARPDDRTVMESFVVSLCG
jgi:DNA polymerase-3 subunit delta